MNMKAIPTGVYDYRELKQENYYSVDKTLMIKDFLERKSKVTLVTRPRRFGKTINMSMMSEFFDITKDSKEIFKGTKIMETPYAAEINQYPTIFISFADAKFCKMIVFYQLFKLFLNVVPLILYLEILRDLRKQIMKDFMKYQLIITRIILREQMMQFHS